MPAGIAHRLFAESYFGEMPYKDLAYIGAQGPDPFMGYGMLPFRKRKDKDEILPWGSKMHNTRLRDVYAKMIRFASEQKGEAKKKCFCYLYGLLSHFVLDRKMHPYVFYRTGFDENGKYGGIYVFYHGYFEALLDKALAKAARFKEASYKALPKLKKEDGLLLSRMWASGATMPLKEDSFFESYRDFRLAMRVLVSRFGFKRKLVRLVIGKTSKPYSLMLPPSMKKFESLDVLNLRHEEWKDPTSGKPDRSSVYELFEQASDDMPFVADLLKRGLEGEDVSSMLDELEANNDHDGGIYGQQKSFCDICLAKLPFEL